MPKFKEIAQQRYTVNNCVFSSGFVSGAKLEIDTVYLRIEKDLPTGEHDVTTFLLTPDELAAIAQVCAGTVWSHLLSERLKRKS